jgi:hypothetical protein
MARKVRHVATRVCQQSIHCQWRQAQFGPSQIAWDPLTVCFIPSEDNDDFDADDDEEFSCGSGSSDSDSDLDVFTPEDLAICVPGSRHELPIVSRKRAHSALVLPLG